MAAIMADVFALVYNFSAPLSAKGKLFVQRGVLVTHTTPRRRNNKYTPIKKKPE
jgi:hypothetical protein